MATGLINSVTDPTKIPGVPSLINTPQVTPQIAQTPTAVATVPTPTSVLPRQITTNETVAGQLNNLLAKDSTYIQSARNRGMETANARGLINSSLAAGTSERAAIDAALPIAQQDSTINANAGQSAQNANQDIGLTGYKSLLDSAQQKENFGYQTQQNAQNIAGNMQLQKQSQEATFDLQKTLQDMDIALDTTKLKSQEMVSLGNTTGPIMQQMLSEIAKINTQPDSVLSPEAKQQAIYTITSNARAKAQTLAKLYGYNLDWPEEALQTAPTSPTGGAGTVATNQGGSTTPQSSDYEPNNPNQGQL